MGMNSLPKTVTRQRRDCDLNPEPYAPESSTLTTRLPSHPINQQSNVNRSCDTATVKRGYRTNIRVQSIAYKYLNCRRNYSPRGSR